MAVKMQIRHRRHGRCAGGVPLASGALSGVGAFYATVQMPAGIPRM